jgi:hypothetical protein
VTPKRKPQVGLGVQYFTSRTLKPGTRERLATPEPIGPLAALITMIEPGGSVHLQVFPAKGASYPVYTVWTTPSTPVQHYWRYVPDAVEEGGKHGNE